MRIFIQEQESKTPSGVKGCTAYIYMLRKYIKYIVYINIVS